MPMNKSVLKKWVRGHVQPYGVKITNLSTSFGDGLAFAALVHQLLSLSLSSLPSSAGRVPTWASLTDDTPLARMAWAFDTAQRQLRTEPLLDAADTVDYQDQRSIMLYLNTLRNATLPNPPRASSSSSSSFRPKKKKKSGIGMQAYKSRSFSPAAVATVVTLPEEKEEMEEVEETEEQRMGDDRLDLEEYLNELKAQLARADGGGGGGSFGDFSNAFDIDATDRDTKDEATSQKQQQHTPRFTKTSFVFWLSQQSYLQPIAFTALHTVLRVYVK